MASVKVTQIKWNNKTKVRQENLNPVTTFMADAAPSTIIKTQHWTPTVSMILKYCFFSDKLKDTHWSETEWKCTFSRWASRSSFSLRRTSTMNSLKSDSRSLVFSTPRNRSSLLYRWLKSEKVDLWKWSHPLKKHLNTLLFSVRIDLLSVKFGIFH